MVFTPSRYAAKNFSLIPPTGSTRPVMVTSPVMAKCFLTGRPVSKLVMAVVITLPAEGPSFGTAPSGKWT